MPSIPIFVLAKHITAVALTPQVVASNGALSNGSPIAVQALLRDLDVEFESQTDEINPITSGRLNNVLIADGYRAAIEVLGANIGADPDPIMASILSADIYKLAYTHGSGGSARTTTIYGVRARKITKTQGRGALAFRFELLCVDVGPTDFVRYEA